MSYSMVDVESDGPIPGDYSMVWLGCVLVEPGLTKSFGAKLRPISDRFNPEALAVSGLDRHTTLGFDDPKKVMEDFGRWVKAESKGTPRFVSDNNGYDWMFVCWYFHHFLGRNPFGYSSTNLNSLYKGMVKDMGLFFDHLRVTAHTHDPVDDARGNAEALLALRDSYDLKIEF